MRYLKNTFTFFFNILIATSAAAIDCDRPIVFGWQDKPPFQYEENESGEKSLRGFDIELITAVVEHMGCQIRYVKSPFNRHLEALEKGVIDLAASMAQTDKRTEYAYFSQPYRRETIRLFIRAADSDRFTFKRITDLRGTHFRLGLQNALYYGPEVTHLKQDEAFSGQIVRIHSLESLIKQLLNGRIDGFLGEDVMVQRILGEKQHTINVTVLELEPPVNRLRVMISKKSLSEDFVSAFDQSLQELQANGVYQMILQKYS